MNSKFSQQQLHCGRGSLYMPITEGLPHNLSEVGAGNQIGRVWGLYGGVT